jgi:hypothetical protein
MSGLVCLLPEVLQACAAEVHPRDSARRRAMERVMGLLLVEGFDG